MQDKENAAISKSDLIAKLEVISRLYKEAEAKKEEAERFRPAEDCRKNASAPIFPGEYKDDSERHKWENVVWYDSHDAVEKMEKFYAEQRRPRYKEPVYQDPNPTTEKNKLDLFEKIRLGSAAIGILLIGGSLGVPDGLSSVLDIVLLPIIVCAALFAFSFFKIRAINKVFAQKTKVAKAEHDKVVAAAEAEHGKKMEKYEADKAAFMQAYAEWREAREAYSSRRDSLQTQWEIEKKAGEEKLLEQIYVPALKKLEAANDLISEKFLPALDDIIDLLRTDRADSLKEAINLYEEVAARERQLELQQAQIAREERDAHRQCDSCVYYFDCNVKYRPNCASYVPKR